MNFPISQISDQIFLIRPDYDNFENIDDERSDCSCVDYIVEAEMEKERESGNMDNNYINHNDISASINENMIEISIETNQI